VVVVKGTFQTDDRGQLRLADQQRPLCYADEHHGDPESSSVRYEGEFVRVKPSTDVILVGKAMAPGGRPVPELSVRLEVAGRAKDAVVVGERRWVRALGGLVASEPVPFVEMPLTFDRAFGGRDDSRGPGDVAVELRNLSGVGLLPALWAISMAGDLKKGSKKVEIGGQPAALHGQSFYKSSPLGNEAATRSFGASVLTGQITGKTFFQASSMDVSFEGKKVNRHLDITTSNHGSQPGGTPPMPGLESMSMGGGGDDGDEVKPTCPCCGGDAHPNQVGPDGKLSPKKKEAAYYDGKAAPFMARRNEMQQVLDSGKVPAWASRPGTDHTLLVRSAHTEGRVHRSVGDTTKAAR